MKLVPLLALLTGCLYWNTDPPPPPICEGDAVDLPAVQLRDPQTGLCQAFTPGGGGCGNGCGPCAEGAPAAQPDWATCGGMCEQLDENTCLTTTGCRAAYFDDGTSPAPRFGQCWEIAPSGPIHGACTNLDAHACSQHDDCSAIYSVRTDVSSFEKCVVEREIVQPPPCETLTAEADCKARPDCVPVYDGMNCTCTPGGCTCQTETWLRCESGGKGV